MTGYYARAIAAEVGRYGVKLGIGDSNRNQKSSIIGLTPSELRRIGSSTSSLP